MQPSSNKTNRIAIGACCGIPCCGLLAFSFLAILAGSVHPTADSMPEKSTGTRSAPRPDLEVLSYKGIAENYAVYVVGTVRNNTDHAYKYVQVEVNLYDKHNTQVGSTMANVNNLEPHSTWKFKALVTEQGTFTYKIKDVTGF